MSEFPLRVSVVIPVLDEERTLEAVTAALFEALDDRDLELLIVDDGSTDKTPELIRQLAASDARVRSARHEQPRGKGSALRTGFALATGDVIAVLDADLEYLPADLPTLLRPLDEGYADVVYGSRFLGSEHSVTYFWTRVANGVITLAANLVLNTDLTDLYTGAKAVRASWLRTLHLTSRSFTIEAELTAKLWRLGARFVEVPVRYRARSYREGKKIRPLDALRAFGALVVHRFSRVKRAA